MEVEYFKEILEIRKLLMEKMYLVTNFLAAAASRAAGTSKYIYILIRNAQTNIKNLYPNSGAEQNRQFGHRGYHWSIWPRNTLTSTRPHRTDLPGSLRNRGPIWQLHSLTLKTVFLRL